MSGPALISIVTPAYNVEAVLAATARSVLAQTYPHWEWIVADDGSTDATREVLAAFGDPRIRVLPGEHSGLPAVARNRALSVAHGDLVAFLDADDVWVAHKLEAQAEFLNRHPDTGLVFSLARYRYESVDRIARLAVPSMRDVPNPGRMFERLCLRNLICTSSVLVRRPLLERFGVMDEDPRQRGTEDYELWLRLAPEVPFGCVERALVIYRVSRGSVSANPIAIAEGRILAVEKALKRQAEPPRDVRLRGARLEARKIAWKGEALWQACRDDCGRHFFLQALRLDPRLRSAWIGLALSLLGSRLNRMVRSLGERLV